ncbi:MAG: ferredoxin [Clostridia bacterium]|nr:ferredoxin [Clostridia bacterium]
MRVTVDKEVCISCGMCVNTYPEIFKFNSDDKAEATEAELPKNLENAGHDAVDLCPVGAIVAE